MDFKTEDEIKKEIKNLALQLKKIYNSNIKIEINFINDNAKLNITILNV